MAAAGRGSCKPPVIDIPRRYRTDRRTACDARRSAREGRNLPRLYSRPCPNDPDALRSRVRMTQPNPLVVAVVGATGVVGRTMVQVLVERGFPIAELRLLASGRSAGRMVHVAGRSI